MSRAPGRRVGSAAAALLLATAFAAASAAAGRRSRGGHGPTSPSTSGRAPGFPVAERLAERGGRSSSRRMHRLPRLRADHRADLRGVTMRRSAAWIERQILHPDLMLQEDPITIDLYNQFMVRMANQGLTRFETRCVIEYLKWVDEDSTQAPVLPATPPGRAARDAGRSAAP